MKKYEKLAEDFARDSRGFELATAYEYGFLKAREMACAKIKNRRPRQQRPKILRQLGEKEVNERI